MNHFHPGVLSRILFRARVSVGPVDGITKLLGPELTTDWI